MLRHVEATATEVYSTLISLCLELREIVFRRSASELLVT